MRPKRLPCRQLPCYVSHVCWLAQSLVCECHLPSWLFVPGSSLSYWNWLRLTPEVVNFRANIKISIEYRKFFFLIWQESVGIDLVQFEDTRLLCQFQFANNVFRTFDKNGDSMLDFREFMTALYITSRADPKERLMWAFEMYDTDGSGSITLSECNNVVKVPRFTKIFSWLIENGNK